MSNSFKNELRRLLEESRIGDWLMRTPLNLDYHDVREGMREDLKRENKKNGIPQHSFPSLPPAFLSPTKDLLKPFEASGSDPLPPPLTPVPEQRAKEGPAH